MCVFGGIRVDTVTVPNIIMWTVVFVCSKTEICTMGFSDALSEPAECHSGHPECVCTDGLDLWRDVSACCDSPIPLVLVDASQQPFFVN